MRTITLFFTQESRELTINSAATTLGELRNELATENLQGKKLTVKETRSTLESSESPLPTGEFTLYVYPAKSKAGFSDSEEDELLSDIASIKEDIATILQKIKSLPSSGGTISGTVNPRIAELKADADRLRREMEGDLDDGADDDADRDDSGDNY